MFHTMRTAIAVAALTTLAGAVQDDLDPGWLVALSVAWAAFAGSLFVGLVFGVRGVVRRSLRTRE